MAIGALGSAASGISAGSWAVAVAAEGVADASTVRGGGQEPQRTVRAQPAAEQPLADGRGVARPAGDVAAQMTQAFVAQRFVQANLVTLRTVAETYRDVVRPGPRRVEGVGL